MHQQGVNAAILVALAVILMIAYVFLLAYACKVPELDTSHEITELPAGTEIDFDAGSDAGGHEHPHN
mgnify:CR=1 FL=1